MFVIFALVIPLDLKELVFVSLCFIKFTNTFSSEASFKYNSLLGEKMIPQSVKM